MIRPTLLLVTPPVLSAKRWWGNRIANKPHIASLAGYVRDLADVQVLEFDLSSVDDIPDLLRLDEPLRHGVSLVGISCWTSMHYLGTLAVAERVRQLAPDIPIVVGGHHATASPGDFTYPDCDWVVRGDGEHVLRKLCTEWPRRPPEMQVVSAALFDQSIPNHVDWDHYGRPGVKERVLWVGTSRGCSFQCRFCVEPQRSATYSRYSVSDTLNILERLVRLNEPEIIAFSDPIFGANRQWIEAFLDGLQRLSLPVMFWAETRTDLMTPELLEAFKRCRFMVDFGLDTASKTMIERMEKSADADRYLARSREILEYADTIGLLHGIYLVFNFPGETPDTAFETRSFIQRLGTENSVRSGWLSAQTFFILPGTNAFERMAENAACYGTEIRYPHWWEETGDHYALATDILPSSAWIGREDELYDFDLWNRKINTAWMAHYPDEVQRFRDAFFGRPFTPIAQMKPQSA